MTAEAPVLGALAVVLTLVGAGIALAGGIGVVAVRVRLADEAPAGATRRALGLWAVGAVLLATGTPGAVRAALAGTPTLRALALVGVAVGAALSFAAPLALWRSTLDEPGPEGRSGRPGR